MESGWRSPSHPRAQGDPPHPQGTGMWTTPTATTTLAPPQDSSSKVHPGDMVAHPQDGGPQGMAAHPRDIVHPPSNAGLSSNSPPSSAGLSSSRPPPRPRSKPHPHRTAARLVSAAGGKGGGCRRSSSTEGPFREWSLIGPYINHSISPNSAQQGLRRGPRFGDRPECLGDHVLLPPQRTEQMSPALDRFLAVGGRCGAFAGHFGPNTTILLDHDAVNGA
mmetsp:Transcript_3536/g.6147  ORF Transcript_3536/g.6147 Transcript_3536/m.6147 type:complete len:220 (-) Transcript_3536:49-708(-)